MATLSFYIYNYTKDEVCTYFGMEGSALSPSRGQKYEFPMNKEEKFHTINLKTNKKN